MGILKWNAHNHDGRYLRTNIKAVTLSKNSLTYTFPSIAIGEIVYASVKIFQYSNSDNAYTYSFKASNAGNYLSFSFCLPTKVSSSPRINLITIGILDGVLYIKGNNKMYKYLEEHEDEIILSSLLLREFLFSI